MSAFKTIEGEYAIVSTGGVFKQVPVAERNGYLFAAVSGGYVRLYANGSTSKDKMRFDEMSWEGDLYVDQMGKLCTADAKGAKMLDGPDRQRLLGTN